MNGLWCKRCLWHKCRCEWTGELRVPWPIKRMTRAEFEKMYADDRVGDQWPAALIKHLDGQREAERTIPPTQYTRTMTMDDLRRNALESVIEELKERDA